jgi:hypothetical protein
MVSLISLDLQESRTDAWLTGWLAELSDIGRHSSCARGAKLGNGFQIGSRLQQVNGYLCSEQLHHKILDNVFV